MRLTKHFLFEEMIATRHVDIDNQPGTTASMNLQRLARSMEVVRKILGNHAIVITSGYRCPELNARVGGSPTSAHLKGLAVDFICPDYGPPYLVCQALVDSDLRFDQIINEYNRWCHFGLCELDQNPRLQALSIFKTGEYMVGIKPRP